MEPATSNAHTSPEVNLSHSHLGANLYEHDLSAWAVLNAQLLRQGRFQEVDISNLAEELEDMGRSEKRALESYVQNVLMHLLKWQFQPEKRSRSWQQSIKNSRKSALKVLRDNPSLKPQLAQIVDDEYLDARDNAAAETLLDDPVFPSICPYAAETLLGDWLPE